MRSVDWLRVTVYLAVAFLVASFAATAYPQEAARWLDQPGSGNCTTSRFRANAFCATDSSKVVGDSLAVWALDYVLLEVRRPGGAQWGVGDTLEISKPEGGELLLWSWLPEEDGYWQLRFIPVDVMGNRSCEPTAFLLGHWDFESSIPAKSTFWWRNN